ncbi:pentatricopeptide repeat-containing protein [Prunus yedoensis var. nudiflora]|uniref:Pentatricopeptide repeat-containing protein n=1 Tax=Prunus yedoensis var. nudiflora TaxID=2094558 RepID=A0A314XT16_PRUYE|nr:pentatricopeptide repeat-containing protein [Prunus yedoensis var. nudiflora]
MTYTTILAFCADHEDFRFGLQLHSLIFKSGLDGEDFVGNALISMYSRWRRLIEARSVFDEMANKDLVSWNAILSGYSQEGNHGLEAIFVFIEMVGEGMGLDHVSFTSAVSACGHEMNLELGKQIHGLTIKSGYGSHVSVCNVLISTYSKCEEVGGGGEMIHGFCIKTGFLSKHNVCNSLITMYAKFESMNDSIKVFEELNSREIISWNALISGYAQNRLCQDALKTFLVATMESKPNNYTFGSVLSAIGDAQDISLKFGQRCHSSLIKLGLVTDPIIAGALLDMYAKRGSICESKRVFSETPHKSQFAWTAIISAYAGHGDYDSVIELFKKMEKEGLRPDSVTFLSILTACSRKGMVEMGRHLFHSMYGGHVGTCREIGGSRGIDESDPGQPGFSLLQSLLGACRIHGNVEMAERVADTLMRLEPMESGSFVLMSNLYAEKGDWEMVAKVRKGMRDKGVRKEVGYKLGGYW